MGATGQRQCEESFSWRAVTPRYLDLYRKLVGSAGLRLPRPELRALAARRKTPRYNGRLDRRRCGAGLVPHSARLG